MKNFLVFVLASLVPFYASTALAAIDQVHLFPTAPITWQLRHDPLGDVSIAQTFRIGSSGRLTGIDLWIDRHDVVAQPVLFDIRTTISGVPTEPDVGSIILQSVAVDASMISVGELFPTDFTLEKIVHIDLRQKLIPVSAGQVLAMTFRTMDPGPPFEAAYGFYGDGGGYSRGAVFYRNPLQALTWKQAPHDIYFRTHVHPIPEPSALCLSLMGIAAVVGNVRSRRRLPRHRNDCSQPHGNHRHGN